MSIDWHARNRVAQHAVKKKPQMGGISTQSYDEKLCERYMRIVGGGQIKVSKQEVGYDAMKCCASGCADNSGFVIALRRGNSGLIENKYYCHACVEEQIANRMRGGKS